MSQNDRRSARLRWAELRFSIVGSLLSSPPAPGELKQRLSPLAARPYMHPSREELVQFSVSNDREAVLSGACRAQTDRRARTQGSAARRVAPIYQRCGSAGAHATRTTRRLPPAEPIKQRDHGSAESRDHAHYDHRGQQVRKSTHQQDEALAHKAALLIQDEFFASPPESERVTIELALARYLAKCERSDRAEGTMSQYVSKAKHLLRLLGAERSINESRLSHVEQYIDTRLAEIKRMRPDSTRAIATVGKELGLLRSALRHMVKQRGPDGFKLYRFEPGEIFPEGVIGNYKPRDRALTVGEYHALYVAPAPERREYLQAFCGLGTRDSELYRITPVDIEPHAGRVRIPGTKTEASERWLQPPADLVAMLLRRSETTPLGQPIFRRWLNVRRDLEAACKRAGIAKVSPNDLRRTFASWQAEPGVPEAVIADGPYVEPDGPARFRAAANDVTGARCRRAPSRSSMVFRRRSQAGWQYNGRSMESALHVHANHGRIVVDHVSAHGSYVTHMRGTLLVNSVENLRQLGVYSRYLELLEASVRDQVVFAIASSWIPIEVALAHYQACDRLKLSERDCQTLGSMMAQRIADTFLGTVLRVTRRAGVESFWSLMSQNSRIWDRMYLGGGVTVIQTGPKDVIVENHGLPLVTSRYWRFAYEAYWKALGAIFTKVAFVKAVRPREAHPHRIALAGSWV